MFVSYNYQDQNDQENKRMIVLWMSNDLNRLKYSILCPLEIQLVVVVGDDGDDDDYDIDDNYIDLFVEQYCNVHST